MSEILDYVKVQKNTKQKIRELVELNKQNVATQAKKAEELTANLAVYNEAIKMMGDEIFDLGVENEALRDKIGAVDEKWLDESKNNKTIL
jgi:3-deoxy-D-manno-octulosonate 8-phosphate phosphatase KdsC-like HAD superfamily phosphatase